MISPYILSTEWFESNMVWIIGWGGKNLILYVPITCYFFGINFVMSLEPLFQFDLLYYLYNRARLLQLMYNKALTTYGWYLTVRIVLSNVDAVYFPKFQQ